MRGGGYMDSLLETYIGRMNGILNDIEKIAEESDDPRIAAVIPHIEHMKDILSKFR